MGTFSVSSKPWSLIRLQKLELETRAVPSDGLIVFSAMWGFAMLLSIGDRTRALSGELGVAIAVAQWAVMGLCLYLIARPRMTWLLFALSAIMCAQYLYRLPVASNNQTIAFFMNSAICVVVSARLVTEGSTRLDRDQLYERLRVVARGLLAVMYFYGIFHKINHDFLNPNVSCAVALYEPLTRPFGLDDNLFGRYGAIAATFVVELIALVCLYWRRFFWVGLTVGLWFHYIIPISAYSWYMDFSSLVLALYMLSVPREVSAQLYSTSVAVLHKARGRTAILAGPTAVLTLLATLAASGLFVLGVAEFYPKRHVELIWHSAWLMVWSIVGGIVMVLATRAALLALPYRGGRGLRQPLLLYLFPGILFVSSLSPYLGLKTESSIAMFSNLHTEGGQTNHLLLNPPPYLFGYQSSIARIVASNHPEMDAARQTEQQMVPVALRTWLENHPGSWVTYELDGKIHERVTAENWGGPDLSLLERKLLAFKPVDFRRPKVCTH